MREARAHAGDYIDRARQETAIMATTTPPKDAGAKPAAKKRQTRKKAPIEKALLGNLVDETGPRADAIAHDAKTVGEMMRAGSFRLRATGAQTAEARLDDLIAETTTDGAVAGEPTKEQRDRMAAYLNGQAPAGLGAGKSLVVWILTGEGIKPQAETGRKSREATSAAKKGATRSRTSTRNADASPEDLRAAEIGTEIAASKGKPLSQRVSPKEASKARAVIVQMLDDAHDAGRFPNAPSETREAIVAVLPALLGFSSERAFKRYVTGEDVALKDDAKIGVKALTKGIASHQVWARKAAAAAWGVMAQTAEALTSS